MSEKLAGLRAAAASAKRTAIATEKRAVEAQKEAETLEQAEAWEKEKAERRKKAEDAIENSTLPKWAVNFISMRAWDIGHTYGQSEVDSYIISWIYDAEECLKKGS